MYKIAGFEGQTLDFKSIQNLPKDILKSTKKCIKDMEEAALGDYQKIIQSDEINYEVLDAVDKYYVQYPF